jgi:hypothetical protein
VDAEDAKLVQNMRLSVVKVVGDTTPVSKLERLG